MQITNLSIQVKNPDRVNVYIDSIYSFSLSINQVVELGIKINQEIDENDIYSYKSQSELGKYYIKTYKYCLVRPRSTYEVQLYLKKKNISEEFIDHIVNKLTKNKILDDLKFCEWWISNRNVKKGSSLLQIKSELKKKGLANSLIEEVLEKSDRHDSVEIIKIYNRKKNKYDSEKMKSYLASKGFKYADIVDVLTQASVDSGDEDVAKGLMKT